MSLCNIEAVSEIGYYPSGVSIGDSFIDFINSNLYRQILANNVDNICVNNGNIEYYSFKSLSMSASDIYFKIYGETMTVPFDKCCGYTTLGRHNDDYNNDTVLKENIEHIKDLDFNFIFTNLFQDALKGKVGDVYIKNYDYDDPEVPIKVSFNYLYPNGNMLVDAGILITSYKECVYYNHYCDDLIRYPVKLINFGIIKSANKFN